MVVTKLTQLCCAGIWVEVRFAQFVIVVLGATLALMVKKIWICKQAAAAKPVWLKLKEATGLLIGAVQLMLPVWLLAMVETEVFTRVALAVTGAEALNTTELTVTPAGSTSCTEKVSGVLPLLQVVR